MTFADGHTAEGTVAGSDVVMVKQGDGRWQGTVTLRVTNKGPKASPAHLDVRISGPETVAEPAPDGCTVPNPAGVYCPAGDLAPGASRTVTIGVVSTADPAGTVAVTVNSGTGYPDHTPGNDTRTLRITAG